MYAWWQPYWLTQTNLIIPPSCFCTLEDDMQAVLHANNTAKQDESRQVSGCHGNTFPYAFWMSVKFYFSSLTLASSLLQFRLWIHWISHESFWIKKWYIWCFRFKARPEVTVACRGDCIKPVAPLDLLLLVSYLSALERIHQGASLLSSSYCDSVAIMLGSWVVNQRCEWKALWPTELVAGAGRESKWVSHFTSVWTV